jgi:ceramide glucosyltransferase
MGHGELAAMALGWGLLSRILLAGVVGGLVVNERDLLRTMLLHPLRDLMGFGYWLASYSSNRILWRGQEYELLQDGMMRAVGTAGGRDANGVSGSDKPRNKEQEPALTL